MNEWTLLPIKIPIPKEELEELEDVLAGCVFFGGWGGTSRWGSMSLPQTTPRSWVHLRKDYTRIIFTHLDFTHTTNTHQIALETYFMHILCLPSSKWIGEVPYSHLTKEGAESLLAGYLRPWTPGQESRAPGDGCIFWVLSKGLCSLFHNMISFPCGPFNSMEYGDKKLCINRGEQL